MNRAKTAKGKTKKFLDEVRVKSGLNADSLGRVCDVSARTIRDWRREKHFISYDGLNRLSRLYNVRIPGPLEILPQYWYTRKGARKGAIARYKL